MLGTNAQNNPYAQGVMKQAAALRQAVSQPRIGTKCDLEMDADLKLVMEFMRENLPASKLVGVAQALAAVAPVLWGHYEREEVRALTLMNPPITRGSTLQSAAT